MRCRDCPRIALAHSRYCGRHARKTAYRGYGSKWQRYSKAYLKRNPYCVKCGAKGSQVDHRIPVKGPDDPLFWEPNNHEALCLRCHSRKTAAENRAR